NSLLNGEIAVESARRLRQIARVHNVVALEDGACLVAGQLHRDPFWDSRTDQIPDGRPPEIMGNAIRAAGGFARHAPGFVAPAAGDRPPVLLPVQMAEDGRGF